MNPRRDHLVRSIVHGPDVRVLTAFTTASAQAASESHQCAPTSAALLAQGLTAGLLLASALEKERARINLQVACDGPAGGLFVDAGADGTVRGYIRNNKVFFPTSPGEPLHPERAIGRRGYVNVLRDFGGSDIYRGMVELSAFDLAGDLRNYFRASEQIDSAVALTVAADGEQPLGQVAGMIVQRLPTGDSQAVARAQAALDGGALERGLRENLSATALIGSLDLGEGEIEVLADYPVAFSCRCSHDRVVRAVLTLGLEEMRSLFAEQGEARATCEFCGKRYLLAGPELLALIKQATEASPSER
jgi:molecular chaperone Hsp33